MSPIQVQMMALRRRSFTGRTDKYAVTRGAAQPVVDQITGQLGFIDVTNGVFGELYRESAMERVLRYKKGTKFYEGEHWVQEYDNGDKKPVCNYCSTVVNKTTDFMVGDGLHFAATPGNELVADLVDSIWTANHKNLLFYQTAQTSSIMGDSLIFVTATADRKIKLVPLNPVFCFPIFHKDSNVIKAILIQYPSETLNSDSGSPVITSLYITETQFIEYSDMEQGNVTENVLGRVPVVHIPNIPIVGKSFGRSDLSDIIPLNEEYNSVMFKMRKIINYHAEPTTVIFGAKASKLEKGANKVWSGLPVDARVENLVLDSDLSAVQAYLDKIERNLCRISDMPAAVFAGDVAVSNTSGIAIRLLYKPLLDKVTRKRIAAYEGFTAVNALIVMYLKLFGADFAAIADYPQDLKVTPVFSDSIPVNENELLDAEIKKLTQGLTSKAESFRVVNRGKDMSRIATEIVMDQRADLAINREKALALQGQQPNLVAPFLGSIAANEDLTKIAVKLGEADEQETEQTHVESDPANSST